VLVTVVPLSAPAVATSANAEAKPTSAQAASSPAPIARAQILTFPV
jgi:hypothetical protein